MRTVMLCLLELMPQISKLGLRIRHSLLHRKVLRSGG